MPTIKEVEDQYDAAIRRAGTGEAAAELKAEKQNALAAIKLQELAVRERAVWMRDALHDYPLASEFPDLVEGGTEDELRTSAQSLHARLERRFDEHAKQQRIAEIVRQQLEQPAQPGESGDGG